MVESKRTSREDNRENSRRTNKGISRKSNFRRFNLTKQILLLPNEDYVIFLNSKCASSSIRRMALWKLNYEGAAGEDKKGGLLYNRNIKKLRKCEFKNWLVVVRNPFDRIVSLWVDKTQRTLFKKFAVLGMKRNMSFKDFVKIICLDKRSWAELDSHLWPQTLIAGAFWEKLRVVRVEDLPEDWPKDLPTLNWENKAKNKIDYNEPWDNETRRLISTKYKRDMELLPYER